MKANTHKEVFLLCYGTQGGYSWNDVYYNMPSYLRRYYLGLLKEQREREQKEAENSNKRGSSPQGSMPRGPGVAPKGNVSKKGSISKYSNARPKK